MGKQVMQMMQSHSHREQVALRAGGGGAAMCRMGLGQCCVRTCMQDKVVKE